jgi:hypothetical protein
VEDDVGFREVRLEYSFLACTNFGVAMSDAAS